MDFFKPLMRGHWQRGSAAAVFSLMSHLDGILVNCGRGELEADSETRILHRFALLGASGLNGHNKLNINQIELDVQVYSGGIGLSGGPVLDSEDASEPEG
jgi:hypothetical protein